MNPTSKQWELSILEFNENGQIMYRVTRRLPALTVAETKICLKNNCTHWRKLSFLGVPEIS